MGVRSHTGAYGAIQGVRTTSIPSRSARSRHLSAVTTNPCRVSAAGSSATTSVAIGVPAYGPSTPPSDADIEIAVDTTGSMGPGIAQARADAAGLVAGVQAAIPNAHFSIVQFRDSGDSPMYAVEQPLTTDATLINTALNRLTAGRGGDAPEAHNHVFDSASVPDIGGAIGWRAGVQKFVVVLSDAEPHGAGTARITGCLDPTVDPLGYNTPTVLGELATGGRTLFMVLEPGFVSTTLSCYQNLALTAGGGSRGVAGGTNLATLLEPLISASTTTATAVTVTMATAFPLPASSSWVTVPTYGPLITPVTVNATVTIAPPALTPPRHLPLRSRRNG